MNTGKAKIRKLSLHRETLLSLQPSDLEDVHGGNGIVRSAIQLSQRYCSKASRAAWSAVEKLSISYSAYEASRAITRSTQPAGGGGGRGGQE